MNFKRKQYLIYTSVSLEIIIIGALIFGIYRSLRNKTMAGYEYVSVLKREIYGKTQSQRFSNFFEPSPGEILNDHPDWLGHNVSYSINKDTFNERKEYEPKKPEGVFRIIILGDSFTYGLFVNTFENYTELLEDMLNKRACSGVQSVEVINLGVPGYDAGYSLERFRMRGLKYNPDLVIWFMNHFTMTFLADYKLALEERYASEMTSDDIRAHEKIGEYWYPGIRAYQEMVASIPMPEIINKEFSYVSELSAYYQKPLIFVVNNWTFWPGLARLLLERHVLNRPNTWIYSSLPSLEDNDGLLKDHHPNPAGHKIIAENIARYLYDRNMLGCTR